MRGVAVALHGRQRVPESHTALAYISPDRILSVFSPPGTELWVKTREDMKKSDDEIPLSPAFFLVMSSSSFPSVYGGEYSRSDRRKNLGNSSLDHCVGLAVLSTTSHGCQQEER